MANVLKQRCKKNEAAMDDLLMSTNSRRGRGFAETLVDLMEKAGELFLRIDGSMNEDELRDLHTYISTMRNYLAEKQKP